MRACGCSWHAFSVVVTLLGEVERVTFENEATSFRVIRLHQVTGLPGRTRVTVVGQVPFVGAGTRVRVTGKLDEDAKHGSQVRAESLVVLTPETLEGLRRYLGSGVVRGVGPVLADRIVSYFGERTLAVFDSESHRLLEVPGLGKARVEEMRASWAEQKAKSNVHLLLQSAGLSLSLTGRIIERFGNRAAEVLQNEPYRLALDVSGIGFKTADKLARAKGLSPSHPERILAGTLHVLEETANAGHTASAREELAAATARLLEVDVSFVEPALDVLWASSRVVVEEGQVFLRKYHGAEVQVSESLARLMRAPAKKVRRVVEAIREFEAKKGITLAEQQRDAVERALTDKVVVITGGPGVGKTTLVQAILHAAAEEEFRLFLAAPTGRAAKRLSESTGRRATTIHRLLEVDPRSGQFKRNADSPLEADLLIVDEASMIDVVLMASLLEALPTAARLVIVGDADQLPSVGAGSVLRDVIASRTLPVVRLQVIFRQAGESGIVKNAHRILSGELPESGTEKDADFFVISCTDPKKAADLVRQVVLERIPNRFGFDPKRDIQVLTPMHRGDAGTLALNEMLAGKVTASAPGLQQDGVEFRVGDKVLQQKNDYERDVWNGDVGEVSRLDIAAGKLWVSFEGPDGEREVAYEKVHLSELTLAYAMSIHKSQGSEYPAVVLTLMTTHFVMLSRPLVYTAVTRAKKLCVLIADPRALAVALGETRKEERRTGLRLRLERAFSVS